MSTTKPSVWAGVILIVISAFGYALMPSLSALAYSGGLNVSQVLFYRFFLSAIVCWLYIAILRIPAKMSFKQLMYLCAIGFIGYTICSKVLFIGYQYVSGSVATMILFAHPIMVVIGEAIMTKVMPSKSKWIAMALAILGLVIILYDPKASYHFYGIVMCFLSALTYAIYCLGLNESNTRQLHPMIVTAVVVTLSTLYNLVECLQGDGIAWQLAMNNWVIIISLAIFATVIPAVTFFAGLKVVGSGSATIISAVEPAFVYWIEVAVLGQELLVKNIIGGIVIALGILLLQKE